MHGAYGGADRLQRCPPRSPGAVPCRDEDLDAGVFRTWSDPEKREVLSAATVDRDSRVAGAIRISRQRQRRRELRAPRRASVSRAVYAHRWPRVVVRSGYERPRAPGIDRHRDLALNPRGVRDIDLGATLLRTAATTRHDHKGAEEKRSRAIH